MRCSACHRPIVRPALELAGKTFGPVCARKALVEAGQPQPRKARGKLDAAQRDDRTLDMFEGAKK